MSLAAHHLDPVLADVLDARSCGLAGQRLLLNHVARLIALDLPDEQRRELVRDCRQLITLTREQARHERHAAGTVDLLIRTARDLQLNGGQPNPLTVKAIGRRLRPALRIIANPAGHTATAYVAAVRAVDDVIVAVPFCQMFSASVEKELRAGGYTLLKELAATRGAA